MTDSIDAALDRLGGRESYEATEEELRRKMRAAFMVMIGIDEPCCEDCGGAYCQYTTGLPTCYSGPAYEEAT